MTHPADTLNASSYTSTMLDILCDAFLLLEHPGRWTTGFLAQTQDGYPTSCTGPDAVRFCVLGAIVRAGDPLWATQTEEAFASFARAHGLADTARRLGAHNLSILNDSHGYEAVMTWLNDSIDRLAHELESTESTA